MDINATDLLNSNINKTEHKKLLELLNHYNVTPDKITKQADTLLISSSSNTYCLKKIGHNRKRTIVGLQLHNYLYQGGFRSIPEHIKTKEGKDLLKYNNSYYYLMNYIEGRISSYNNIDDIKNVSLLLASFHLKSQGFYNKYIETQYKASNWSSKENKYKETFRIIREYIKNKGIKTMFDILYLESIDFFEEQLELSVQLLNQSNYSKILQSAQLKCTLCLNNFKFKDILLSNNSEYYLTNLDDVKYNMVVFDLCRLLTKTLYRKEYSWNFKYAREILDNYCLINPLSRDELKILLSLIIFPKYFYKLGKGRYIKKKKWSENKYLAKLYYVTNYIEKQREFSKEYMSHYSLI